MGLTLLSESTPKARKNHICDWCGQLTEKSETYYRYTGNHDGDFQYTKLHLECRDAMDRDIKDFDHWDYTFTPRDNPRGKTIAEEDYERITKTQDKKK